jgi:hypothetical protein
VNEAPISFDEPGIGKVLIIFIAQAIAGILILYLVEKKEQINFRRFFASKFRKIFSNNYNLRALNSEIQFNKVRRFI